jgi:hypothetical protein
MTMAEVAREDREQGWKKGDGGVRHRGSGYKRTPRRPLDSHDIQCVAHLPTTPLVPQGNHVGLTPCLGKENRLSMMTYSPLNHGK